MAKTALIEVTPSNIVEHGLFCVKDVTKPGAALKRQWYAKQFASGMRIKILTDEEGEQLGFIEYAPCEAAWKPVFAPKFMLIQCLMVYPNKNRHEGNGSQLLSVVEDEARNKGMAGVCMMTSNGPWVTDKRLLEKNGYAKVDELGRFELMVKQWDEKADEPVLIDWTINLGAYKGWHLIYADQCPWNDKSVKALEKAAAEHGIDLHVHKLSSPEEAKCAPSGFAAFSLIRDGRLLEDHYLSETRFRNILKKELALQD